jgi:putative MATE family efflux protein
MSPGGDAPAVQPALAASRAVRRITEGSLAWGVLWFGVPLVVGMALYTTFNLIDMFMISRLENAKAALGALGICDMVAALPTIISNGVSTGTVAIIARRLGEGDQAAVARTTWQSLVLVGLFSIFFGLIGIFLSPAIVYGLIQAKGEVAELAARYLRVLIGGAFSIFFLLQVTAILRALGRPKAAASLLVGGNLLNLWLNLIVVYGPGPHPPVFEWIRPVAILLHAPRMGMQGTAWATLIARTIPVVIGLAAIARISSGRSFSLEHLRPDREMLLSLIRIGWPSSVQLVVRIGAILVVFSLINANYVTASDSSTLTAYSICLRIETLILFLGMGWGAASSSFMGTNLGAGQRSRAHLSGWIAAGYNALLAVGMIWLFITFADPIIGFFESSPGVLTAGKEYLEIVAPSYVAVAIGVVLSQAITGAGATLTTLAIDGTGLGFAVIPAMIVAAETLHQPARGLWWTVALGNVVIAIAFAAYYATGRFLDKKV